MSNWNRSLKNLHKFRYVSVMLLILLMQANGCGSEKGDIPVQDSRNKRAVTAVLKAVAVTGCISLKAVKTCTDLLKDCTAICKITEEICDQVSTVSSAATTLINFLCQPQNKAKLIKFVNEDLQNLPGGGSDAARGFLEKLGNQVVDFTTDVSTVVKDAVSTILKGAGGAQDEVENGVKDTVDKASDVIDDAKSVFGSASKSGTGLAVTLFCLSECVFLFFCIVF